MARPTSNKHRTRPAQPAHSTTTTIAAILFDGTHLAAALSDGLSDEKHKDFRPNHLIHRQHLTTSPCFDRQRSGVLVFLLSGPMTPMDAILRRRGIHGTPRILTGEAEGVASLAARTREPSLGLGVKATLADSALRGLDSGRAAAGAATMGGLQPPSGKIIQIERRAAASPSLCRAVTGGVPNRHASRVTWSPSGEPVQQTRSRSGTAPWVTFTSRDGSLLASVEE